MFSSLDKMNEEKMLFTTDIRIRRRSMGKRRERKISHLKVSK